MYSMCHIPLLLAVFVGCCHRNSGFGSSAMISAETVRDIIPNIRVRRSTSFASMVDQAEWAAWSKCTAECDGGTMSREKHCRWSASSKKFFTCRRTTASCNTMACNDTYANSEWTPCSAVCDRGIRGRVGDNGEDKQVLLCGAQSCDVTVNATTVDRDIVFVLDASAGEKERGDIDWFAMKQFTIDVINAIRELSNHTHIAVVDYSNNVNIAIELSANISTEDLWNIRYSSGCTNTFEAVHVAGKLLADNKRHNVVGTIVLITDGYDNIRHVKSFQQATDVAMKNDIDVIIVGIGEWVDKLMMKSVVKDGKNGAIFVQSFEDLPYYTDNLVENIYRLN